MRRHHREQIERFGCAVGELDRARGRIDTGGRLPIVEADALGLEHADKGLADLGSSDRHRQRIRRERIHTHCAAGEFSPSWSAMRNAASNGAAGHLNGTAATDNFSRAANDHRPAHRGQLAPYHRGIAEKLLPRQGVGHLGRPVDTEENRHSVVIRDYLVVTRKTTE